MSAGTSRIVIVGFPVIHGSQIVAAMPAAMIRPSVSRASQKRSAFRAGRAVIELGVLPVKASPPWLEWWLASLRRSRGEGGLAPPCIVAYASPDGGWGGVVPPKLTEIPRACLAGPADRH